MRIDSGTFITEALGVSPGDLVSIAGAGGKTSLMYGLGQEFLASGQPALLTTTTRIRRPERHQVPRVILGGESEETIGRIAEAMRASVVVLAARTQRDSKFDGYSPEFVEKLHSGYRQWAVVSECDGAEGKSLKVPRDNEPPMPASTNVFVVLVGADCLGRSLDDDLIFRPESVAGIAGVSPDSRVDEDLVAEAVLSERSYLGRKPPGARLCVFLNKVDPDILDGGAGSVIRLALRLKKNAAVERVCLGSLKDRQKRFLVVR